MAANLEIDIMPVKGFFLKGDIKVSNYGPSYHIVFAQKY